MRLAVISSSSLSRKGLSAVLTSQPSCAVVLDLAQVQEDLETLRKAQVEILLFHACHPARDLETVSRLHKLMPTVKILLILDDGDEEMEFQALRAGVSGCVSRAANPDILLKAIEVVAQGEIWASHHMSTRLISKLVQAESADSVNMSGLTHREAEILALLAAGTRNKEIATRLSVSENTVKSHLNSIYQKINVDSRLAATLYYFDPMKSGGKPPHPPGSPPKKAKEN